MIKIGVFTWVVLSVVISLFPIGFIIYFISKDILKYVLFVWNKINSTKILKKVKKEMFDKNIIENYESISSDAQKNDLSSNDNRKQDSIDIHNDSENLDEVQYMIQEDVDSNMVDKQYTIDELMDKEFQKKQKKLIEKIVYDALVYRKEGKLDEYEKKIIEGLAIEPNDRDLNKLLADFYFNLGSYKKALSLLKKIVEFDPMDHKAIWQIGEIYLITGDFETAELLIEKAILINQSNPKYYISLVEVFYNTDRKKQSIEIMERVLKLRPTNSNYMLTLADLYLEVMDFDNAKKYYLRVLEYEPNNEKAKDKLKELN